MHMTALPRGLRPRALAAGALGIAVTAVAPAAAEGQTAAPQPAPEPTTVSIHAKRHTLSGTRVKFAGKLSSGEAGRRVGIKRRTGDGYVTLARTKTGPGGRYSVK